MVMAVLISWESNGARRGRGELRVKLRDEGRKEGQKRRGKVGRKREVNLDRPEGF